MINKIHETYTNTHTRMYTLKTSRKYSFIHHQRTLFLQSVKIVMQTNNGNNIISKKNNTERK